MFIKGDHIGIRALEPADAEILYRWENNPDLWPVSHTQMPFSRFVLEEFVNTAHQDIYTNKQLRLMVEASENNQTIGIIDLYDFDPQHNRCGVGIYIHGAYRQKGHALACIEAVKTYAFGTLKLKQLFAHVGVGNVASKTLFEKAGFEKNGCMKCWNKTGLNIFEDVWFLQCINHGE